MEPENDRNDLPSDDLKEYLLNTLNFKAVDYVELIESSKRKFRVIETPATNKESITVLWNLYKDSLDNARHHETQRSSVTNLIIVIAGGISSVVAVGGFSPLDLPLTILLFFVGLTGAMFSLSHFARYKTSKERSKAYLSELDYILFGGQENVLKKIALVADEIKHNKRSWLSKIVDTHIMWLILPLMVVLLGGVLTYLCYKQVGETPPAKILFVDRDGKLVEIK